MTLAVTAFALFGAVLILAEISAPMISDDKLAETDLNLWDQTAALMQEYRIDPPASCITAQADADSLRALKHGKMADRRFAIIALASNGRRCVADLKTIKPQF
jgi:hypothetical protein